MVFCFMFSKTQHVPSYSIASSGQIGRRVFL